MNYAFDVLVVFIDGTKIIVPNVSSFTTDNTKPNWRLEHANQYNTYISKDQVRLIGRKKDLEGCI